MTFVPKPCAEKIMATSGDISDFPSSSGTSGYSGGELDSLTVKQCYILGNLLYSCTEWPVN